MGASYAVIHIQDMDFVKQRCGACGGKCCGCVGMKIEKEVGFLPASAGRGPTTGE